MTILTQALGLIASLAILVLVHELGHFFFARLFKIRVEKFYMFFNPWFSILRVKKINGKYKTSWFSSSAPEAWKEQPDNTEWGIGWLPLGGYCAIAGMVDETKKADDLPTEPQPWEFRAKPAWQRLFVILGGVLVNLLSGILIYIGIMFSWGESYIPYKSVKHGLSFSETAQNAGFKNGDFIVDINGKTPERLEDATFSLMLDDIKSVRVLRHGDTVNIEIPKDFNKQILASSEKGFIYYNFPAVIDSVIPNFPADSAGLRQNDSIVGINERTIIAFSELEEELAKNTGKEVLVYYFREGKGCVEAVTIGEDAKLGFYPKDFKPKELEQAHFLEIETVYYGIWASIPRGVEKGISTLTSYIKQFKLIFTKEGATQIGGFGTIGSIFPKSWDWHQFWAVTAFISIILAFMNFLPVPGLDGGYFLFILVEMITGKKPSDKFLERANTIGFILLIALLIWANGLDVFRLFK